VNAATTAAQALPSVASDSSGNFVVVWVSQNLADSGVFGRRYASAGSPLGAEFRVSTYATSNATFPAVASAATGRFVVVWESFYPYGASAIRGRRYDDAGAPLGAEFRVNTLATSSCGSPSVASSPSGDFVVVWQGNQDGSGYGVFGRRFDSSGVPRGAEFSVNSFNLNDQSIPSVAVDADGSFAVVWQSEFQDGALSGVFGRRYDSVGTALGSEFRVNAYTTNDQTASAIAGAPGGGFVAVWQSDGQDGDAHGVFGRRFCPPLLSTTVDVTGATTICPTATGGTATVTDVDGGTRSHQWCYRTSGGPRIPMAGRTGAVCVVDGASFPGPGSYYLSCYTTPECGTPTLSNEVVIVVAADTTPPSIAAPPPATFTQATCN
jgi:hypothetical protein